MSSTASGPGRRSTSTRRRILEGSRAILESRGGSAWSVDEVAREADLTRMTVYRYFPSRTELLLATVRHVDAEEDVAGRFAVVGECHSGPEALDRWVQIWVDYVPRVHRLAQALLAARASDPAAAAAWDDRMAFLRDGCRRIVSWLEKDGLLARELDIETATDLMWALVSIQVWDALTEERSWTPERYGAQLRSLLRAVLLHGLR
jgi:AcrR family transcriptional regulator